MPEDINRPDPAPITTDDEGEKLKKADFERRMEEQRVAQNLPEGGVPEQRPIASQTADNESDVFRKLKEAGDDRAGAPAMDKAAYDRAASVASARKAASESVTQQRLFPGARAWIDNEGAPDHGRAVAVNRVSQYASAEDRVNASSGVPELALSAQVTEYECMSRDGRAELLMVSAEHLRPANVTNEGMWGKTPV